MGLETAAMIAAGALVLGAGTATAQAAGAFDKKPKSTALPEDRRRVPSSAGRAGTILTKGALSQTSQPVSKSALLGGNPSG